MLFGIVANDTDAQVVLCSTGSAPQALASEEMTATLIVGVDAILVMFPDFQLPPWDRRPGPL